MGNKENKETEAMTHSVQVVQTLSFNHSKSCSLSREWYTYIDVDGTGMGGRNRNAVWGRHGGIFMQKLSHNLILSLSIQELARCQMPKYVWKTALKNAQKPYYFMWETKETI